MDARLSCQNLSAVLNCYWGKCNCMGYFIEIVDGMIIDATLANGLSYPGVQLCHWVVIEHSKIHLFFCVAKPILEMTPAEVVYFFNMQAFYANQDFLSSLVLTPVITNAIFINANQLPKGTWTTITFTELVCKVWSCVSLKCEIILQYNP